MTFVSLANAHARNLSSSRSLHTDSGTRDFYGTAYGQTGEKYEGFKFGDANVQFDDTLLLIEPGAAQAFEVAHPPVIPRDSTPPVGTPPKTTNPVAVPQIQTAAKAKSFYGSADVTAATAKMRLVQIADEMISILAADPTAEIKVRLEIHADFPSGAQDTTKRAVSENAKTLGFNNAEWE